MFISTGLTYEEACVDAARKGAWQLNWATLATANLLRRLIYTIYPPLPGVELSGMYNTCNRIFAPPASQSVDSETPLYIMWSSLTFDGQEISKKIIGKQ